MLQCLVAVLCLGLLGYLILFGLVTAIAVDRGKHNRHQQAPQQLQSALVQAEQDMDDVTQEAVELLLDYAASEAARLLASDLREDN